MLNRKNYTLEIFLEKYKKKYPNTKYSFDESVYVNSKTKMKVKCPIHGEFMMRPNDLLNGVNCPRCGVPNTKYTIKDFIEKARKRHGDYYEYSKTEYNLSGDRIKIICPEHGEFWQIAREHLRGYGCPKCGKKKWKLEQDMEAFLEENNIHFLREYSFLWLKNKNGKQTLDFYLPDFKVAIECQGKQHFGIGGWGRTREENKILYENTKERDKRKKKLCEEHNIKIYYYSNLKINYPYKVYENKNELLNDILKNGLG